MRTIPLAETAASAQSEATFEPLVTAAEAYPALERLFLNAKHEIHASFRIFDPTTRLRSDEGCKIGETWFDLICHTLSRGVAIDLTLSDFDPVFGLELHQKSWKTFRQLCAARECSPDAKLTMRVVMHPAKVGFLKRCLFWPVFYSHMKQRLREFDQMSGAKRTFAEAVSPGLMPLARRSRPFALPPVQYPATHHQKLAVADRKTLFIGGLDLNERRYDDTDHQRPGHQTWHDVSVLTTGVHVADAVAHLQGFWKPDTKPVPQKTHADISFLRTLSRDSNAGPLKLAPHTQLAEIESAHLDLFAGAKQLIYLETQFLRSQRITRGLVRAAKHNPNLRLILILPAAPDDVAFENSGSRDARFGEFLQARALRHIRKAFGHRVFIGMSVRPAPRSTEDRSSACGAELIYIHSKIAIADDSQAIVSSANLNGRSMRWDTEAGLHLSNQTHVSLLRRRLFEHWLPKDADGSLFDLSGAQASWANLAADNAKRAPNDRNGFIVPYDLKAAEDFGRDVPFVPPEMV